MAVQLDILIVEDEALLLMQLEMLLEQAGHNIVGTAMSSKEAIEQLIRVKPDLALIDINLLDGNTGLDVAEHLKKDKTMVVFMTANAKRIPSDYVGAVGVITKPFSQEGMANLIEFLQATIRCPPPTLAIPLGFTIAPSFESHLAEIGWKTP